MLQVLYVTLKPNLPCMSYWKVLPPRLHFRRHKVSEANKNESKLLPTIKNRNLMWM